MNTRRVRILVEFNDNVEMKNTRVNDKIQLSKCPID